MWDFLSVSGRMDDRVTEFVDHLHEHFVDPAIVRRGRYVAPASPGYSSTIRPESREAYRYPGGPVWTKLATATARATEHTDSTGSSRP
jgi:L-fuconate dehydratase